MHKETTDAEDTFDSVKPWPASDILALELDDERAARWFADASYRQSILENDRRVTAEARNQRPVTRTRGGVLLAVVDGGTVRAVRTKAPA